MPAALQVRVIHCEPWVSAGGFDHAGGAEDGEQGLDQEREQLAGAGGRGGGGDRDRLGDQERGGDADDLGEMIANRLRELAGDFIEKRGRCGDAGEQIFEVAGEALGLGHRAVAQRAVGDRAFESARIGGADQPDAMAGHQLDVVATAAEHAGRLIAADDASAAVVAIDLEQHIFVIA